MKLKTYRVTGFRSVWDSNAIQVDEKQTCLVGKNESGKTALLQALYGTNPVIDTYGCFDPVVEYPKDEASDYTEAVQDEVRDHAVVVECEYELDDSDLACITDVFGKRAVRSSTAFVHRTYYGEPGNPKPSRHELSMELRESEAKRFVVGRLRSIDEGKAKGILQTASSWGELRKHIFASEDTTNEDPDILGLFDEVHQSGGLLAYVTEELLWPRAPKFMYFDEYYQMRGGENLEELIQRVRDGTLRDSDYPLLGFLRLAGTEPDRLLNPKTTQGLRNLLQGASRRITRNIVKYWSQNRHLEVEFQVLPGTPEDPDDAMRNARANIWALVRDSVHGSSTEIDRRSRGFVWFFSFLAWYGYIRKEHGSNLILLLDEPGLSLHGKAQHDLLRYFTDELSEHQIIYTTHSPFMFDIEHDERIRVVQDKSIDALDELPRTSSGTKVMNDLNEVWTDANDDTLFPLLTAMGIEMWQMDFVGKNRLIVEGPSDKYYLDSMSLVLEREGREGLSRRWVIIHAGGKYKVSPIAAILNSQKGLNIAVLLDVGTENDGKIQDLYKKKVLKRKNVRWVSDFTHTPVADMEDMFERDFYVQLVNDAYAEQFPDCSLSVDDLVADPRLVKAVEKSWKAKERGRKFSHLRPATYLVSNLARYDISKDTKGRFEAMFKALNTLLKD